MRSNSFRDVKRALAVFALLLSAFIMFYLLSTMFISMGFKSYEKAVFEQTNNESNCVIIIDPGHGGKDPGAVANDLIEKDLNMDIAMRLCELLRDCGYDVVLTRNGDYLLYDENISGSIKRQDLVNRVEFANLYPNSCYVAIHMNKYPAEYCKGLQTFYSNNNKLSNNLAENIQNSAVLLQSDNKRVNKDGTDNIFVLENLKIPAVLVECGFLSNQEEANMLLKDEYKQALAFSIYYGIAEFMEIYQ